MTRVLVCGSRSWLLEGAIWTRLHKLGRGDGITIIHGAAAGPDSIAEKAALAYGFAVERYPADWYAHGRGAGPRRNQRMLDEGKPDLVIAFHDGTSRGTADMIRRARKAGVAVEIHEMEAA